MNNKSPGRFSCDMVLVGCLFGPKTLHGPFYHPAAALRWIDNKVSIDQQSCIVTGLSDNRDFGNYCVIFGPILHPQFQVGFQTEEDARRWKKVFSMRGAEIVRIEVVDEKNRSVLK
jgi:hypothetical protein